MKAVLKVIHRALVVEFYKQNAAFFGLILLVFFGFIKSSEHLAIGAFLVSNPFALLFLYIVWLIYVFKVIMYQIPAINKSENQFLASFFLLTLRLKTLTVLSVAVSLLIPVLAYAGFLVALAISHGFVLSIFSIVLSLIIMIALLGFVIFYRLNGLPHEKKIFQIRIFRKIILPETLFFTSFLLRKEIVLLFLTKLYSCSLLIGIAALYRTDDFDLRLMTTGILLAFVGNVAIVQKYLWFQYHPLAFTMNLPRTIAKIIFVQLITIAIFLIPEIFVIFRHYPLDPTLFDLSGILLFGLGLCHLMYALMLRKQVELSDFLIVVFWIVVLTTFLILFSIHPLILGVLILAISVTITYFRHDQYEYLQ